MTTYTLKDTDTGASIDVTVIHTGKGLAFRFGGYGDAMSEPGLGEPVYIEAHANTLLVHVWEDINNGEPVTHDLAGAREELYDGEVLDGVQG